MITLLVALVILGLVLYLVNSLIPMPQPVRVVVNVLACLLVIIWLLDAFHVGGPYPWRTGSGCR